MIISSSKDCHFVINVIPILEAWVITGGIKNIWFHFVLFSHFHVYLKNLNHLVFETVRRDLKNELYLPCPKINAIYYFVVAKIENSKDLKALGKILLNINIKGTISIFSCLP